MFDKIVSRKHTNCAKWDEIIDEYGNYDSPAIPLLFITTFSAGFIFIAVLIVDIIVALAK